MLDNFRVSSSKGKTVAANDQQIKENTNEQLDNFNSKTSFDENITFDVFYNSKDDVNKNKLMNKKYSNENHQEEFNNKGKENFKKVEELLKNNPNKELVNEILEKMSNNKSQINSLDNIFNTLIYNIVPKADEPRFRCFAWHRRLLITPLQSVFIRPAQNLTEIIKKEVRRYFLCYLLSPILISPS